jgi:hypothetical protein
MVPSMHVDYFIVSHSNKLAKYSSCKNLFLKYNVKKKHEKSAILYETLFIIHSAVSLTQS